MGALPHGVPPRDKLAPALAGTPRSPGGKRLGAILEPRRMLVPTAGAVGIPRYGRHDPAGVRPLGPPAAALLLGKVCVHGAPRASSGQFAWKCFSSQTWGPLPGPLQPPWQQLAAGHGGSGAQHERLASSSVSIPDSTRAAPWQHPRCRQKQSMLCVAGTRARIPFWMTSRGGGGGEMDQQNPEQKTLLQFSGRFSLFLADPNATCRHPAEADLYVQALQAKCFLVETACRQTTEKDAPLPMMKTDGGEVFFSLHAWKDLVNKIASQDANNKFRKNVICPKC